MSAKWHLRPSPARGRGGGERVNQLRYAKYLRSNQTEAEQRLWYHLRAQRFMGLKFKRQKPIGTYIADFVCIELRLLIEADGGQHGGDADAERDAWFRAHGYTVLRFWNHEILGQTEAVLERIRQAVTEFPIAPSEGNGGLTTQKPGPVRNRLFKEDA